MKRPENDFPAKSVCLWSEIDFKSFVKDSN